jgi:PEGA domain-containing protein/protein kinase-like protein
VFRAYDSERERLVAIKLFKLDLPPERVHQLVGAFERLIAADLTHPTLSAPRATGIADVAAYLVQDYIVAESLDLTVREHGAARPAHALRVAVQLADALDCAASVNIFHGTLHPRDVLLSSDDTRLTGVGVARALEQVGVTAPVRRPYTAPERMAGAFWDRRADVFSLAALVHELLWARRVSALGADAGAALTPLEGGDAAALRTAFARALAENPEERFATARDFAEVLTRAFPGVSADSAAVAVAQPTKRGSRMELEPRLPLSVSENNAQDAASEANALSVFGDDTSIKPSAERYEEVDLGPIADERQMSVEVEDGPVAGPVGLITGHDQDALTPLDRARSAVWPLVLALTVGLAMGFAGGYGVGSHDRTPAAASAGREFTENAVADSPKKDAETARAVERAEAPAAIATPPKESSGPVRPAPAPTASTGRKPDTPPAATAAVAPSATESGRLLIRSTPDGASVSVDGRDYGKTPATVRDLARGPHQVRVTRDGYAAQERRVVISSSRPSQSVNVAMVHTPAPSPSRSATAAPALPAGTPTTGRATGALAVDSRPTGARVFLDGKPIGTTPLMVPSVAPGEHAIRLELDGYRSWTSSVRMVGAESNRVTASLER